MTPYKTRAAKKNLREGIKKMEKTMSPAAQVRREFQLGRRPSPRYGENEQPEPLHPMVAWGRAHEALAGLRGRMTVSGLDPEDVRAHIVIIHRDSPDTPNLLALEKPDVAPDERRMVVMKLLAGDGVITLGMILQQRDRQTMQNAYFPYYFFGLTQRDDAVLRKAAEMLKEQGEPRENLN